MCCWHQIKHRTVARQHTSSFGSKSQPPTPFSRNSAYYWTMLLGQSDAICLTMIHAVCLRAKSQLYIVSSDEIGELYTLVVYPWWNRTVWFSKVSWSRWKFSHCLNEPPCDRSDLPHRLCANFKCRFNDVNHWIHIDLTGVNCIFVEYDQSYEW